MKTATMMVQGTSSDAGKSTLVAGICRVLFRKGINVAPFKPQNMALNSAVTLDGGEIGRAQAVQAKACGLLPHTDMNPILLKPNSDINAQIIVHGKAISVLDAVDYHAYKKTAMNAVLESYHRMAESYQAIIVEGAGSPAEINLRENDIANMGFAETVDCPVIIVADIDRGGVFAQLVGTLALLSESEQARVKGFIINRFRGDIALLQNGLDWLEKETHKPVLGVLPYIKGLHLEAEDALPVQEKFGQNNGEADVAGTKFKIIVPVLPRISNHTDFDPLRLHTDVDLQFIGPDQKIPSADLIILPGSKSVIDDLNWLRSQGWGREISRHLRYGGKVMGICGGYQMLGNHIYDPDNIEGQKKYTEGLSLLDIETHIKKNKTLKNIRGQLLIPQARNSVDQQAANVAVTGYEMTGYEIHAGITSGNGLDNPVLRIDDYYDGAISKDNHILGCYIHGLFDAEAACTSLLQWAGLECVESLDYEQLQENEINRLADTIEAHIDMPRIVDILQLEASIRP